MPEGSGRPHDAIHAAPRGVWVAKGWRNGDVGCAGLVIETSNGIVRIPTREQEEA